MNYREEIKAWKERNNELYACMTVWRTIAVAEVAIIMAGVVTWLIV